MQYHKMITFKGDYFMKEYETIKHHKNKVRIIQEATVAEAFKKGSVEIVIHFEDSEKIISLDEFSSPEDVKKYLGANFLV